jgi:hypothetical protein
MVRTLWPAKELGKGTVLFQRDDMGDILISVRMVYIWGGIGVGNIQGILEQPNLSRFVLCGFYLLLVWAGVR